MLALAPPSRAAAPDPLFDETDEGLHFPDPLEDSNRAIFRVNHGFDTYVMDPVSRAYRRFLPGPVRRSVLLFFGNLNSPSIIVNDVLQREWRAAVTSTARTCINSTVGIGGFFDPATRLGFPYHGADFGQTLALAGMPSGPYLIVPLLGPTNARDAFGTIIDFAFRPTTYLLGPLVFGFAGFGDQVVYASIQGGGSGFVARAQAQREIDALHDSSMDFYATLRTAYYQVRMADVWRGREHHKAIRERALFIRRCQSSETRSYRGGSPTARRILPASRRRCSPSDEAPAR